MKRLIYALCIAGTLTGCASQATRTQLDYAQRVCASNPAGSAEECASIPALQAQASAEASENTTLAVATIALLPLAILLGGLGGDSEPHYHHHHYYHHR
jgi:hypothetical protein